MQLSKRLQAVADLVTIGNAVADVGCDHAYISIYLAKQKNSPRVIAMDVNQGPIDRANENIIKYGCENKIETRKSNGLQKLEVGEVDTILIGGMGGALTIQILSAKLEVMTTVKELVLQPQSEINKVRQFLQEQKFCIVEENMLYEDGKYYVMMRAIPKEKAGDESDRYQLTIDEHFYYGRLLLEVQNSILKEFLLWDLSLCEGIRDNLLRTQTDNSRIRLKELEQQMELIQKGLKYFE